MTNLSLQIDTVNGTGSLFANQLLTRMIFRSNIPVGSYNFFPSNIAGLPCSYNLRLNADSLTAYEEDLDILISFCPQTFEKNIQNLKSESLLITDQKHKLKTNSKITHYDLPISEMVSEIPSLPVKMKPFCKNIVYVGLLTEWLQIENDLCIQTIKDFIGDKDNKEEILKWNLAAFEKGQKLAKENPLPTSLKSLNLHKKDSKNKDSILMDGNTAMALGALFSGCQFLSWYPITPASSLSENFEKFAGQYLPKKSYSILQSEDEIAALNQAIGAGWTGIRAMTVTSGPGLSLMSEAAGLSYFSEVPVVLSNIQRAGPSTGLPTRTSQSDFLSCCFLSHGDNRHIVLMPSSLEECFYFTQMAFDLAEQLQTLVIVLSDLNLGMNLQTSKLFEYKKKKLNRGKVLNEEDLKNIEFARYKDVDGDGISYRSLPGTKHKEAAYLTRGSGHNERAEYSEDSKDYKNKLEKLKRKWQTAQSMMPKPVIDASQNTSTAFITFGNNDLAIKESRETLKQNGTETNFMRVTSFPFHPDTESFLEKHSQIFVVEQNRDGQLKQVLSGEFPEHAHKLKSILQYDGRPFYSGNIEKQFQEHVK